MVSTITKDHANIALMTFNQGNLKYCMPAVVHTISKSTWIGISAESYRMTKDNTGMYDVKVVNKRETIGNGNIMNAEKFSKWKGTILQADGASVDITLN
jgi:hypothetical protein